jgi:hypothetical protein
MPHGGRLNGQAGLRSSTPFSNSPTGQCIRRSTLRVGYIHGTPVYIHLGPQERSNDFGGGGNYAGGDGSALGKGAVDGSHQTNDGRLIRVGALRVGHIDAHKHRGL